MLRAARLDGRQTRAPFHQALEVEGDAVGRRRYRDAGHFAQVLVVLDAVRLSGREADGHVEEVRSVRLHRVLLGGRSNLRISRR